MIQRKCKREMGIREKPEMVMRRVKLYIYIYIDTYRNVYVCMYVCIDAYTQYACESVCIKKYPKLAKRVQSSQSFLGL